MNYADRVKDTSASVGTGPITLFGAPITGFRSFLSAFPAGAVDVPYAIDDGAGNWEIGIGSFADSVLTRTQVLSSSSNGGLVDFVAGKKSVICTLPADLVESATNRSIAAASESAGHAEQTGLDRAATAADRLATAADKLQTGIDAEVASSAKSAAESAATDATASKTAAAASASNAAASASTATTKATQAATSASNAAVSASAASDSATNASTSATSAGNSASTATNAKVAAEAAATSAQNSESVISNLLADPETTELLALADEIQTVSTNIESVNTVSTNIDSVNTVASGVIPVRTVTGSGLTITIDADTTDILNHTVSDSSSLLVVSAPSGTPYNFQRIVLLVQTTNQQTYNWNSVFSGSTDLPLPVATTAGKAEYLTFVYSSVTSKWNLLAKLSGF